jgi:arginine decarboxylase-like protein
VWTIENSKDLYGFERWGNEYFGVSAKGNVTARTLHASYRKSNRMCTIMAQVLGITGLPASVE